MAKISGNLLKVFEDYPNGCVDVVVFLKEFDGDISIQINTLGIQTPKTIFSLMRAFSICVNFTLLRHLSESPEVVLIEEDM